MKPLCIYCCEREATTVDHVPPKVCFPAPRPTLITVPACPACNNRFSKEDEEFASFLSLRIGMDAAATARLHEKNKRIVAHNRRLLRTIREKSKRVWIKDGGIFTGQAYAFHWDGESHDRMVRRIIRGLYFYVFKRPLSPQTVVHGSWSKPFGDPEILDLWKSFAGEDVGAEGQFRFRYAYSSDQPELSVWMMTFYDRHFATGHTGIWGDETEANQTPEPTAMAVTPPAAQEPRQP